MPLSRDFKKLIVARANTDPDFFYGYSINYPEPPHTEI